MKRGAVPLLASLLALSVASPATAKTPAACHLLTQSLIQDYFFTDMSKAVGVPAHCAWNARIADIHRSGSLILTKWRNPANARAFFKLGCEPNGNNHPKNVTVAGADQACVSTGYTGICFDKPTGRECQWEVAIAFRRGNVTGEQDTVAPRDYSLNNTKRATRLLAKVLARWH